MFLHFEVFKCIVKNTPLISIDFLVKKENKFLLGKRINPPAKGDYFTIVGRIFKNETIQQAQKRILKEELSISINYNMEFIGVFGHFYEDSIFGNDISTHYVNLAYFVEINKLDINYLPFEQHTQYKLFYYENIIDNEKVHTYVKKTFKATKEKGII
ncbi:NUDIX domain-containing protein [Caminibacter mediatlanticus TB-2]|uniref:NUDIX domain-containing protein n=1 Tax=Caminibacter mediatlanticus TB-2 TaxID=391592 RepID=A0ABX5V6R3_9BACT|nr:NUDIX domain-containing protein [Caminibacter mediatlanticus]QCT93948.1 NUDIX domain-containing protein [Caminibacter mediatlanticus TB-2]